MRLARLECRRRLDAGETLGTIEAYIDRLPVSPDGRAALWLWAWIADDRRLDLERVA